MKFASISVGAGFKPTPTCLQSALALLLWLVAAVASAEVPPLDEIRSVLRAGALTAPSEEQLASLTPPDLADRLAALDPYARWLPPTALQPAGRIGAELYADAGQVWLLPYADSPAQAAGVTERTLLKTIDGVSVSGRTLADLAERLTGAVGQVRRLGVCTPPCQRSRELTVTLAAFQPRSLEVLTVAGQRLLRIRAFTARETKIFLHTALTDRADAAPVIDLRAAGGGDLFEALDAAGLFLAAGQTLAVTTDRAGRATTYRAAARPKVNATPVLLIGPHTASAAEVFAGILHGDGRACLVGMPSYGKCVSQTEVALRDGSVLRYTNRAVQFADGTSCEGRGLIPDVTVDAATLADTSRLLAAALACTRSKS